jgi:hypothetical protein
MRAIILHSSTDDVIDVILQEADGQTRHDYEETEYDKIRAAVKVRLANG